MKSYIAIDLKSFYASVECVEREMDPLGTNLVVADESRTEKTICLAVSPALKAYGLFYLQQIILYQYILIYLLIVQFFRRDDSRRTVCISTGADEADDFTVNLLF